MRKLGAAVALLILAAGAVYVIAPPYDSFTVSSRILREDRTILEYLPAGYDTSSAAYPVLVLLDATPRRSVGGPSFYRNAERVSALGSPVPAMIVLGVTNTHRTRDMIPAPDSLFPPAPGEAHKFLRFMTEELLPVVEARYRTTGLRVLYGGSDAGLFALYALTAAPDAFQSVIASSPSLQRSPGYMADAVMALFARRPRLASAVFLVYGTNEGAAVSRGVPAFADLIRRYAPHEFALGVSGIPGGGHVPTVGLEQGLQFVFGAARSEER